MQRSRLPAYTIHIVSSVAVTSLAFHMLSLRQRAQSDRVYLSGKISILQSLVDRTRKGEHISNAEFERMTHLANSGGSESGAANPVPVNQHVTWKDAVLGRRRDEESEQRDLEAAQKEWEDALAGKSEETPRKPFLFPQSPSSPTPPASSLEPRAPAFVKEGSSSGKKTVFY